MNDTDARFWHPWLRNNRVLRVIFLTRWAAEAGDALTKANAGRRVAEMLE